MQNFVKNSGVVHLVEAIEEKGLRQKHYSDIIDSEGNQYVDLVQEGGGVLGIALAGYTYILEKAGIRFFSLAGTSAGAINAMLIAGKGRIGEPVSEKIIEILDKKELSEFVDGNSRMKNLIRRYLDNRPFFKLHVILNFLSLWRVLKNHLGLNPGEVFERWLAEILAGSGIRTMTDLEKLRSDVPVLFDKSDNNARIIRRPEIKIIASDITTKSKIIFPEMAELYWSDPGSVSPSKFVRASMSVPLFFFPFEIRDIPGAGKSDDPDTARNRNMWRRHAAYYGEIPNLVRFVDGGMLSNFPINAFHLKNRIPKKPTFGVKLSTWRGDYSRTSTPGSMMGAMVSTMRQLHDYEFLRLNPDYNKLICHIDADGKFNWLDFNMPETRKIELFLLGARKAYDFLSGFDWAGYKKFRSENI